MIRENLILQEIELRNEIMNNFNENYLLEAGAGAGKTTIIVERIINHIIKSDIEPSTIVAITFTKAASTELAERIQIRALEAMKNERDRKVRKRLARVDEIFTGTIHSFCDLILREMPFEAGLSPGYEIIEDSEDYFNRIWFDFLRNMEEDYKKISDLLRNFNIDYRDLRTRAIVAMENPDIKFIGYEGKGASYEDLLKDFDRLKNDYGGLKGKIFKKTANIGKLLVSILEEGGDLSNYVKPLLKEANKYGLDVEETYEKLVYKKYYDCEESQDYINYIGDIFKLYEDLNSLAYNNCTKLINMALKYKEDNYRGKLSFNELLYKASKLIKDSQGAREHFRNKYSYYYVDEFQDTDPMQAELILNLTDSRDYNRKNYWGEARPRPGSLFVVGDPKQSIYRFRRADISIYNQVKNIIGTNGQVAYLDINFRSSDDICAWVEETFKIREDGFGFPQEATMVQAGFKKILSLWDDRPASGEDLERPQLKGLYNYWLEASEEKDQFSEEVYVARLVKDLVENYSLVEKKRRPKEELRDGEDEFHNITRKIEVRDIMILSKSNRETGLYLRALKDYDIPALLAGEKLLGDTREVLNIFLLVDALLDYRDNIKLIAALRNCFYLELDSLELFLEESRDLSTIIFRKEKIARIEHPHIREAFNYLHELSSLIRRLSPISFIENLIKSGYGIYDMHRDYSDLEKRDIEAALVQSLELLKARRCASIYEIRNELDNLVNKEVNYELPLNSDYAKNSARVMNIHKSKGLESPIVFLVGGDKKTSLGSESHYVEKALNNENLGFMVYRKDYGIRGPEEDSRKERERLFKEAENQRLLYVAATRAKSSLIVAGNRDEKLFLNPLNFKEIKRISTDIVMEENESQVQSKRKLEERDYSRELRLRRLLSQASYIRVSPSKFTYQKNNLDEVGYLFGSPSFRSKRLEKHREIGFYPKGSLYGNMVHRAMEVLIKKTDNLRNVNKTYLDYASSLAVEEVIEDIEINRINLLNFYPLNSPLLEDLVNIRFNEGSKKAKAIVKKRLEAFVKKDLEAFIRNKDIRDIFNRAAQVFTELQFSISLNKDRKLFYKLSKLIPRKELKIIEEKTGIVNGVIDLVVRLNDGSWLIIDYKTDSRTRGDLGKGLVRKYGGQIEGYKFLLEAILKDKDIRINDLFIYSTVGKELFSLLQASPAY